jgi:hypothetical protein
MNPGYYNSDPKVAWKEKVLLTVKKTLQVHKKSPRTANQKAKRLTFSNAQG